MNANGKAKKRDVIDCLFDSLDVKSKGQILREDVLETLRAKGILEDDLRIRETVKNLKAYDARQISAKNFREIIGQNVMIAEKALAGGLVIPDFKNFCSFIVNMHNRTLLNKVGKVSDHTPVLKAVNPEQFAISVCTVDGQRFSIGDSTTPFLMQGITKAITYCIILEELKEEEVRKHIGREQETRVFDGLMLNKEGLPHNAFDDAGALVGVSLIEPHKPVDVRRKIVLDVLKAMSGGAGIAINEQAYSAEKNFANKYSALTYFMQEKKLFPKGADFMSHLDLFLQCLSMEVTTDSLAAIAATLAGAGICPLSGQAVFKPITVRNCLSTLYFCGMGAEGGDFSFTVGLPAIGGKSGGMMVVIPNVMGIAVWSPRVNDFENSARGMDFCHKLIEQFNFHPYDSTVRSLTKTDPRLIKNTEKMRGTMAAVDAASRGELHELKRLAANGVDLNEGDYDLRTPMHLAAAEGHAEAINYFISLKLDLSPKDRWGGTPMRDAENGNHREIIALLQKNGGR